MESDLFAVFYTGSKKMEKERIFREIFVSEKNPFKEYDKNKDKAKVDKILKHCPGTPIYYRDYCNGASIVAVINQFYDIQYFNKKNFLYDMIKKAIWKNKHFSEKIENLDLSDMNLYPNEIKYLTKFNFENLKYLDLSFNSLGDEGCLYLILIKLYNLTKLNLESNIIGDNGLQYISCGTDKKSELKKARELHNIKNQNLLNFSYFFHYQQSFSYLSSLNLSNNNISSEGIKYLMNAEFISNLKLLSLNDNLKIGDTGIKIMTEQKSLKKLEILDLNRTGLSDISLVYIENSKFSKLKNLGLSGNNFTSEGNASLEIFKMNNIEVNLDNLTKNEKGNVSENIELKENNIIFNKLNKYLNFYGNFIILNKNKNNS